MQRSWNHCPPRSPPLFRCPPIPSTAPEPLEYESAQFAPGKGGLIAMSLIFFCIGALTGCGGLAIPFMLIPAVMGLVMFVGISATLVWFFQRRRDAETLWFYDPFPGWTDRCPIPVLAWSLWNGLGALGFLGSLDNGTVPVFGFIITGNLAVGIIVLVMAIMLCAAIGIILNAGRLAFLTKPIAFAILFPLSIIFDASKAIAFSAA